MVTNAVCLAGNWLEAASQTTLTTGGTMAGDYYPWLTYNTNSWWYVPYAYTYTGTPRPIRLTMKEVERLRAAAKKDKALKAVLAKFTDQIEVIVDFEEVAA